MEKKVSFLSDADPNTRADLALLECMGDYEDLESCSRSQLQKWIEAKRVLVNGLSIKSKDYIPLGALVEIFIPEPIKLEVTPENIPIQILFEDEHLLVVNKQPGLTMHPSETQPNGTLVNALLYHVKNLSGIGGVLRPGIVHRIDKDTSGAVVITKTDAAHLGLSKQFSVHSIERKYWAFTYGALKTSPHTLHTRIGRSSNDRKKMAVYDLKEKDSGREAITHFTNLKSFSLPGKNPFASLVESKLETGRTHQVRVHLTHLGHSLLGDTVYGVAEENSAKWKALPKEVQESVRQLSGQALHARILGFIHPITQEKMLFEAEPFEALQNLIFSLKKYE